ncbi:hypothetical protein D083_2159 [Dickeya solani RNS 08.23.3.1.A]|nr:hypothetical protein D083_2159 [Dickeya solani RNS 08.23.3.1.A]
MTGGQLYGLTAKNASQTNGRFEAARLAPVPPERYTSLLNTIPRY